MGGLFLTGAVFFVEVDMLMLDICSGVGGAHAAMTDRGWQVVTVDIDARFAPSCVADIRDWHWGGPRPDLLWMSPPCVEFARESMPWCRTGVTPDFGLVLACLRLVEECAPRFWVLENVRGAVPYLGGPVARAGAFHLWGAFPPIGKPDLFAVPHKCSRNFQHPELRARVPYPVSLAVALAVERQPVLFDFSATVSVEVLRKRLSQWCQRIVDE